MRIVADKSAVAAINRALRLKLEGQYPRTRCGYDVGTHFQSRGW